MSPFKQSQKVPSEDELDEFERRKTWPPIPEDPAQPLAAITARSAPDYKPPSHAVPRAAILIAAIIILILIALLWLRVVL